MEIINASTGHSFKTYGKFSKKFTFPKNVNFSENFVNVLNELFKILELFEIFREAAGHKCSTEEPLSRTFRSSRPEILPKKAFRPEACNSIRIESPTQVFSCEFCKIVKTSFHRTALGDYF